MHPTFVGDVMKNITLNYIHHVKKLTSGVWTFSEVVTSMV